MTGEGLPILVDLVDRGVIRLIDLVFFTKADDGSVAMVEIADFDGDGELDMAIFEGASSGILGEDDINPAGFHRLAAGSRMSTMMSPTIVLAGDRPRLALGSGGSNRIRSAILQTLLNVLAFGRPLDEAVNASRQHIEGRQLWFETSGLAAGAADALQARWPGATRFESASMFFGGVNCVASIDGQLAGAGDQRRGGIVLFADDRAAASLPD
jgi:gamma-glutamyltranspeptidase/glutathione hydrolase